MRLPTLFCTCLGLVSLLSSMAATGLAETPEPYVVFLGTGAADIQRPQKGDCPTCTYVREHGGRNARRYASLFVSPGVLIDYSVTGREGLDAAGIAPSAIGELLITHSHSDHFNPAAIVALAREKAEPLALTGHLNFPFVRLVRQFLVDNKRLKPEGRFMVPHLSLHFCEPYDLLAPKLAAEGILVSDDGLRVGL